MPINANKILNWQYLVNKKEEEGGGQGEEEENRCGRLCIGQFDQGPNQDAAKLRWSLLSALTFPPRKAVYL